MRTSIKRLRGAYAEYMSAKQARYDELADWDAYDSDALEKHKKVALRISLEERACMRNGDDPVLISIDAYIMDDVLYKCHYYDASTGTDASDERLFDLT